MGRRLRFLSPGSGKTLQTTPCEAWQRHTPPTVAKRVRVCL